MNHLAVIRFARHDRRDPGFTAFQSIESHVNPQTSLAHVIIDAVAKCAVLGQNRLHLTLKIDRRSRRQEFRKGGHCGQEAEQGQDCSIAHGGFRAEGLRI